MSLRPTEEALESKLNRIDELLPLIRDSTRSTQYEAAAIHVLELRNYMESVANDIWTLKRFEEHGYRTSYTTDEKKGRP